MICESWGVETEMWEDGELEYEVEGRKFWFGDWSRLSSHNEKTGLIGWKKI